MTDLDDDLPAPVESGLLGWVVAWGLMLTVGVIGIAMGETDLWISESKSLQLGFLMGGLAAAWSTLGTWLFMVHRPRSNESIDEVSAQPIETNVDEGWKRSTLATLLFANVAILAFIRRQDSEFVALVLVISMLAALVPLAAFQWTRQPIRRTKQAVGQRRSIRQILGLTATVAVGIAGLQMADRWIDLKSSLCVAILSSAALWILMLAFSLGRWWGMVFLTVPVFVVQAIAISLLIQPDDRNVDAQILVSQGYISAFYFFSLLFLTLLRSSGHRWLRLDFRFPR